MDEKRKKFPSISCPSRDLNTRPFSSLHGGKPEQTALNLVYHRNDSKMPEFVSILRAAKHDGFACSETPEINGSNSSQVSAIHQQQATAKWLIQLINYTKIDKLFCTFNRTDRLRGPSRPKGWCSALTFGATFSRNCRAVEWLKCSLPSGSFGARWWSTSSSLSSRQWQRKSVTSPYSLCDS